jgi:signal transduction histidine kinase
MGFNLRTFEYSLHRVIDREPQLGHMKIRLPKSLRESFGVRVFTVFASLIAFISISFTAFLIYSERESLTNTLIKEGKLLANTLAHNSRIDVFSEKDVWLEDLLRGVLMQESVLEASVYNMKGDLIRKQERPGGLEQEESTQDYRESESQILSNVEKYTSPFHVEQNGTFQFWAPVLSGSEFSGEEALLFGEDPIQRKDSVIGIVRITIDKKILQTRLTGLLIRSLLIGTAFLLVGFGAIYLIVKGVTKPLKELTEGVTLLGMGGKVEKISVETKDEIFRLAGAFNTMSESLKEREKALRESEKRLRSLSSELLKAQEKERRRLSNEIHDELGQCLALLKHRIRSIEREVGEHQPSLRKECEETSRFIDETIESVRRISRDLSPSILEDLGLSAALRWLLDSFAERHSIQMSFDVDEIDGLFSQETQTNLYRISQEALTNIGRHAEASRIRFVMEKNEDHVSFFVEDNGKGFDVNQIRSRLSHEKGMGLAAMVERAHMLGAILHIRSSLGEGTRVSLKIPFGKGE